MISFIVRTVVSAIALLAIAGASEGQVVVGGFGAALIAALLLGLANSIVKPILQYIAVSMTCVLSCLTLGLSSLLLSWLLNAAIFYFCGSGIIPGFQVKGFVPALWGALVLSGVNALITILMRKEDEK